MLNHPAIKPLQRDYDAVVPHIYVVRILKPHDRNFIQKKLLEKGIQTGIHYQPNHKLSFYNTHNELTLPVTDEVHSELLSLPLHPDLTYEDLEFICEKLKNFVNQ